MDTEGGLCTAQVSAGGLVSALMGVSNFKTCWVGWPGTPYYARFSPHMLAMLFAPMQQRKQG